MHVLVTDDSYKAALGIVRSLGRKGIRVSVLADSPIALASRSRYCTARYLVPPSSDRSFLSAVLSLFRRVGFDLVMPVGYATSVALAQHRQILDSFTRMEIADHHRLRAAADKMFTSRLAREVGVPIPGAFLPASFDDAVTRSLQLRFPVVIKMPCETPGAVVRYARTRQELLRIFRPICERASIDGSRLPMIQEFIPGFGCGFFAIYDKGACKRIFMHKRIRETPPSGGASCCAASFYDSTLKAHGMRMLGRIAWHGVAMVEFRYDERDGEYKFLEINPKFWGSLDLALAAGVDFPYALCQMAAGRPLDYSENYNSNLRYHWLFPELQHVWNRPSSLPAVLADSVNPSVQSNFWWRDPKPNLLEPFARLHGRIRQLFARRPSSHSSAPIPGRLNP